MIEMGARALARRRVLWNSAYCRKELDAAFIECAVDAAWRDFTAEVTAVLEAIRDPIEAVLDAMRTAAAYRLDLPLGVEGEREKYRRRWQAGVDAALGKHDFGGASQTAEAPVCKTG